MYVNAAPILEVHLGRAGTRYLTPDERRPRGKALRQRAPRQDHGPWEPPEGRRDPVELLSESNQGRIPELIPIRFGRMMQSPFAFYRGSPALMAADLAATPKSGLMVQACGDAHLMNFGGFATPERNIVFDINYLDETLLTQGEWDLKRLDAIGEFAMEYADHNERDYRGFVTAVKEGRIEATADV